MHNGGTYLAREACVGGCALWGEGHVCMAGEMATAADGTYSTGMHSCNGIVFILLSKDHQKDFYPSLAALNTHTHSISLPGGTHEPRRFEVGRFCCMCRILADGDSEPHSSEVERLYCTCRVLNKRAREPHSSEVGNFYLPKESSLEKPVSLIALMVYSYWLSPRPRPGQMACMTLHWEEH